jgi:predicted O-linked N-acetylglucosamine transferase (SPINDLY family)
MGVPVLTLPGERLPSRQTLGFLDEMGMTELAASSPEDFVARGAALARDTDRIADYRRSLRPALEQAKFCDGATIMANVETAFRQMWRRHCRGESPEAFTIPREC